MNIIYRVAECKYEVWCCVCTQIAAYLSIRGGGTPSGVIDAFVYVIHCCNSYHSY